MPSKFDTIMLPPFKGLNLRDDPSRLNFGELLEATNIIVNPDGSTARVPGYTNLLASSLGTSFVNSLKEFHRYDGSTELFFEYNGTLYKCDPVTWAERAIYTGLTASARIGYVSYNDYLYFGNGFDENKKIVPTYTHYLNRAAITTANATDEASAVALANALKADYTAHIASTAQHNAADTTNTISSGNATAYASALTLANELKTDYNTHRSQSGIHPTDDSYHEVEHANATDNATTNELLNEIKLVYNQHIGYCRVLKWSITPPTTAPTLALAAGSELEVGEYYECYTFYNKVDGIESAPSPATAVTTTAGNERVALSAMDQSTDPQVTHKRIYRTVVGGAIYYRVAEITNKNTTYSDLIPDASLGTTLLTESFSTVPNTNIFLLHNNRIYMSGDPADSARLYYTEAYYPERYNSANPAYYADSTVTGLAKTESGILLFEKSKTWMLAGSSPFDFSQVQQSDLEGCSNSNGVAYIGTKPVWVNAYGVRQWDGATVTDLSDLIKSELNITNKDSASLVYDAYNNRLIVIVGSS